LASFAGSKDATQIVPTSEHKNYLEEVTREGQKSLAGSVAEEYLKTRGLTSSTMDYFRLGYCVGGEMDGRITMPYITTTGVVAIRYKAIPTAAGMPGPKVLSAGDSGTRPYNVMSTIGSSDAIYITEGEPDTWTAHEIGLAALGIPGASGWKSLYRSLLRYRRVIVLVQNDDEGAGRDMAGRIASDLACRRVLMPTGHDLNSFYLEAGRQAVLDHIGA